MHDSFTKGEHQNARQARRVNDCFIKSKDFVPPGMLFGELWREGELAMLFGAAGAGKSVLAMQIADSIARGRGIEAFKMEAKRQKVLYIDLVFSDTQFQMRYTHAATPKSPSKHHQFSQNLYRELPGPNEDLCKWMRGRVSEEGYKVVIIDDINAVSQTCDGTRETLKLMRELRRLKDELEISVLVLAGAREPGWNKTVSEADMQRSRVLCAVADSVFALGRNPRHPASFYMVQTRSRSAAGSWTAQNAPYYSIEQAEDGFLKLRFDDRFAASIDEETMQLICEVKRRRDAGATYRAIAEELRISRWKACELFKKWKPELTPANEDDDLYGDDDYEFDDEGEYNDEDEEGDEEDGHEYDQTDDAIFEDPAPNGMPASDQNEESSEAPAKRAYPVRAALLSHLKRSFDNNDREIFVEREDENGKPIVWYLYDTTGQLSRYENKGFGPSGRHVDGPICLFNTS